MHANARAKLIREVMRVRALRASLAERLALHGERFCPNEPHAKQREFLELTCLEALYGGAAGGGKSECLLMAALQYVHHPRYAALLLRRTYADLALAGALMGRAHQWLADTGAVWNGQDKRWLFPSGATLSFGYLDTDRDKYRYQSSEFQFVGFDELTQFPESSYRYLISRVRRTRDLEVPLRVRSASNPGGLGHDWVHARFVDPATRGDRAFVSARLDDNPSIDAVEYRRSLAQLDSVTRRQLEEGVWIRDTEGLVYRYNHTANAVAHLPALDHYLLGLDFGFRDDTAFVVLGWRAHDATTYVVESWKVAGQTPSDVADQVRELERKYGFAQIVGDVGGLGKGYAEEARARFSLPIQPAQKANKRGYIDLLNGDLTNGRLKFALGSNAGLIDEMQSLPWGPDRRQPAPGFADHLCDALLYAWRASRAFVELPVDARPAYGTPAYWQAEADRLEQAALREVEQKRKVDMW